MKNIMFSNVNMHKLVSQCVISNFIHFLFISCTWSTYSSETFPYVAVPHIVYVLTAKENNVPIALCNNGET